MSAVTLKVEDWTHFTIVGLFKNITPFKYFVELKRICNVAFLNKTWKKADEPSAKMSLGFYVFPFSGQNHHKLVLRSLKNQKVETLPSHTKR